MDDYNHMMESEHPDVAYPSQVMNSWNEAVEACEPATKPLVEHNDIILKSALNENENENVNEVQAQPDDQSVSASAGDVALPKTDEPTIPNADQSENQSNAAVPNDDVKDADNGADDVTANEQNELSNLLMTPAKEDTIDLNQCSICLATDNLLDIFRIGDRTSFRICDLIMKLAPAVKVSERDYLPHSICGTCVDRIEAAYELRLQCEESDKILRSKLKRSTKTRRPPSEFVLIDCAESSSDSDDDQKSDDEFLLSEESEDSSESDSDSSYDEKKKRNSNLRSLKRPMPQQKRPNATPFKPVPAKVPRNSGVVYIKASKCDEEKKPVKAQSGQNKSSQAKPSPRFAHRCEVCNRPCSSAEALAQHRRSHTEEKCQVCSMVFKQRTALLHHMQRHKGDPDRVCSKCQRVFTTKAECERHIHAVHPETVACTKCKRYFPNKSQLDSHKCGNDRKPTEKDKKPKADVDTSMSGRDLFKSVAPLTTTYWSDSFSD